jgi:hypothetical protein
VCSGSHARVDETQNPFQTPRLVRGLGRGCCSGRLFHQLLLQQLSPGVAARSSQRDDQRVADKHTSGGERHTELVIESGVSLHREWCMGRIAAYARKSRGDTQRALV